MVVSDLLRAAMVLLIPLAAVSNFLLVYPLLFLITSDLAVLPAGPDRDHAADRPRRRPADRQLGDLDRRDVRRHRRLPAGRRCSSRFLGEALPLAFWIDAVTYVASAVLIGSMAVPRLRRRARRGAEAGADDATEPKPDFRREMLEGWHFLRHETVLLANTIQGVVGQFAIGATIAITALYATVSLDRGNVAAMAAYGFLETGVGVGNLIGGFAVGLIGARLAKGRMVIAGYTIWGICVAALGLDPLAAARDRPADRDRCREHDLRHPEPDAVPAADAAGAHRPGRRLPVHARLRVDDARDGRRRAARDRDGAGGGDDDPGHGHDRGRAGRPVRARRARRVTASRSGTVRCARQGPLGTLARVPGRRPAARWCRGHRSRPDGVMSIP